MASRYASLGGHRRLLCHHAPTIGKCLENGRWLGTSSSFRCGDAVSFMKWSSSSSSMVGKTTSFSSNARLDLYDEGSIRIDEENTDTVFINQPWKDLIETPARAAWRSSDPMDENDPLRLAQRRVLQSGNRTDRQLARAHRKVVAIQENLESSREQERRRLVNGGSRRRRNRGGNVPSPFDEQETVQAPSSVHPTVKKKGFVAEDSVVSNIDGVTSESAIIYGYDETLAALRHRLVPNFAITRRVLQECQSLVQSKEGFRPPRRILDFGVGCGSASAAAIDVFGGLGRGDRASGQSTAETSSTIQWIHGIDPSQSCRQCSKLLLEEYAEELQNEEQRKLQEEGSSEYIHRQHPRFTFGSSLSVDQQPSESSNDGVHISKDGFDLILSTYTASDMPDIISMVSAAAILFEKLSPDGLLVFIEPGTPDGFSSLRAVRNMLLDCCRPQPPSDDQIDGEGNANAEELQYDFDFICQIVAPCTHHGTCPMERHKRDFDPKKGKLPHDLPQEPSEHQDTDVQSNDKHPITKQINEDDEKDSSDEPEFNLASETKAFQRSFCSFVHNINDIGGRSGGLGADRSEKFSYLVVQKKRYIRDKSLLGDSGLGPSSRIPDLLSRAFEAAANEDEDMACKIFKQAQDLHRESSEEDNDDVDWDELGLQLVGSPNEDWGRIIRAPIKKKGHVYVDYCAAPGKIIRSRITKAVSNNVAPGMYTAARKARWGGIFPRLESSDDIVNKK